MAEPREAVDVSLRELLEQRIGQVEARLKEELSSLREAYMRDLMQFKDQDREARHSLANRIETALSQRAKQAEESYHLMEVALSRTREDYLRVQTAESERIRIIEQERVLYVTRDRLEQTLGALELQFGNNLLPLNKRLEEILTRVTTAEQARANLDGRFSMLAMVLSVLIILFQSVISYFWRSR